MNESYAVKQEPDDGLSGHFLAARALNRVAGAPLVKGNRVRLLLDARENYPAWLEAIRSAERSIHFESYIIHEDSSGHRFAEAFASKVREGVKVKLIYDWVGGIGAASRKFWRSLMDAGIEVRCFNPPLFDSTFGWFSRDHRKVMVVDGRVGFVSGLCVGKMWEGDPDHGIAPWRDTGIEVLGPAVADIQRAFAETWSILGSPLPAEEIPARDSIFPAGDVALRIVASMPNMTGLYRLDQLIAACARKRLWLADAYFAGTTPYVQALRSAAADGVDVRLLVPRSTDIPVVRALSRAGFRPLLESGVKVYEWNGTMMHAKTAVADGKWARVGSSNLNLASWLSNWELDAVIENERFAQEMESAYSEDLTNATEIVLSERRRIRPVQADPKIHHLPRFTPGSSGKAAAGALSIGSAVGAAITKRRVLGTAEARDLGAVGAVLALLSIVSLIWPRVISVPIALFCTWLAISLFMSAFRLHKHGKQRQTHNQSSKREKEDADYPTGVGSEQERKPFSLHR